MLLTIGLILIGLWFVGLIFFPMVGFLIHILFVVAVIMILMRVIKGR